MLVAGDHLKLFLHTQPIDMRKAIDGLVAMVVDVFETKPQSGDFFLFLNKRKDKLKLVYWDRNGFVMHYKRLDKGRFKFLFDSKKATLEISNEQLGWLLAGVDF